MTSAHTQELIDTIRNIYRSNPSRAEALIEQFLESKLKGLPPDQQLALLQELERGLQPAPPSNVDQQMVSKVFSILLGQKIAPEDLSSKEIMERLSQSINTVFDTLNQIIQVINQTFMGRSDQEETIRQIIGHNLSDEAPEEPLEEYLGKIQEAFLITHRAFKAAALSKVSELLEELDPQKILEGTGGFKLGVQRRAEGFTIFQDKFKMCKEWLESGGFTKALLTEFEKNCQRFSRHQQ